VKRDPHEQAARLAGVAKDDAAEDLLLRLNEVLAEASLPAPAPDPEAARRTILYTVGVPRSGTTVLAQLIARHLPLGYVDGVVARFWRRPSVGIALSRALLGPIGTREIALASVHGSPEGATGPHEFGYFWRHWLRLDEASTHHLSVKEEAAVDASGLRHALEGEILAAFRRPVTFRNAVCGLNARLLSRVHPACLFVWIRRPPLECARSILRCRMERFGSYDAWWSLKPSTWPFGGEQDPAVQVARQVTDLSRELAAELGGPAIRTLIVEYTDLCRNPGAVLERIRDGLAVGGEALPVLGDVPKGLRKGGGGPLPESLERTLGERLSEPRVEPPASLR
jgi:hypothetical protein